MFSCFKEVELKAADRPEGLTPTRFDCGTGIAGTNHLAGLVGRYNRAGCDNGLSANSDAWRHKYLRANPSPIRNDDGFIAIRHVAFCIIVVARAEKRALGNTALRTDLYGLEIQNKNLLTHPSEVAQSELPGKMNVDARFDHDAPSNLRAKAAQQGAFEPGRHGQWSQE
jgi:hypothetical protein